MAVRQVVAIVGGAAAVACWGETPAPPAAEPAVAAGPNVLIVLWDTVRADRMSLYGATRPTTPKLEAFARDAAVFDRAIATDMWTLPTHASMFTGRPPSSIGATASNRFVADEHVMLAEHLREAGYDTFASSANLIASPLTNLMQGFDTLLTTFRPNGRAQETAFQTAAKAATQAKLLPEDRSTEVSPGWRSADPDAGWDKAVYKDAAPVQHRALLDWLDAREDPKRPWLAYLNFMEAHTPRIPSDANRRALLDDATRTMGLQTDASLFTEVAYMVGKRDYTDGQLEAIRGVYDASLRDLDDATDALFADLRQRGVLDDTVVILVADHGESLGEHRMMEHRYHVYEQLVHVPLVVRYPKGVPAGRRSDRVSTMDVFSTVAELTGVDVGEDPARRSTSLFGARTPQPVFIQMLDPYQSSLKEVKGAWPDLDTSNWERTFRAVYDGSDKLIVDNHDHAELYDVDADPGETTNRAETEAERVAALKVLIADWEAGLAAPPKRERCKAKAGTSQADQEQLELLGYAEPEEEPCRPVGSGSGRRRPGGR